VEGLNVGAFLAGYLAVAAFALSSLAAAGALIAGRGRAARILFAGGLLGAALLVAGAVLSFLEPQYRSQAPASLIVVSALSLFLSGVGQFLASLRSAWGYAVAFAFTAASMLLVASPLLGGDWTGGILGEFGQEMNERGLPIVLVASLLPAAVSAGIGVSLLLFGSRQTQPGASPFQGSPR
jgi:hypothetical protein